MHHHTELSFVDEFRWVSRLHYLKNGWQNVVLCCCMLQAGLPSLHYYCTVVLHSCILLTPVGHSSNHEYHCCQLTRQSSCVSNCYCTLMFSFDSPSYLVRSWDQNTGQKHNIKTGNTSFGRVEQFKYLGTIITNHNCIHEETKSRVRPGNACNHSVQNLLSPSLLSKNIKIKIYRTIILPVILYGCETWSLTLREVHGLRMFKIIVLRKIFYTKRDNVTRDKRRLQNKELYDMYCSWNIIWATESRRMRQTGHVACMGERGGYCVLVGKPFWNTPFERPKHRWERNIKMDLQVRGWGLWTGLIWLRTETSGRLLWMW